MTPYPSLEEINQTGERIAPHTIRTPTLPYYGLRSSQLFGDTRVWLKMELLQRTGSFKARGALNNLLHLDHTQLANGVTAFSAGNHAIATAYAASCIGTTAKVVMPETANPYRIECCKKLGAEIVLGKNISDLMQTVSNLVQEEGRTMIHPFEGPHTFSGTATAGLELCQDAPPLDAVIVPVGGGGLISGIASAVKQINPGCKVYGVEPEGAAGMSLSLAAGAPVSSVNVSTIADSLGAPMHLPLSYAIADALVDEIVTVSDSALSSVMQTIFTDLNLVVEPACAAAMTALAGPLKQTLNSMNVGVIMCGSNIDQKTFNQLTSF